MDASSGEELHSETPTGLVRCGVKYFSILGSHQFHDAIILCNSVYESYRTSVSVLNCLSKWQKGKHELKSYHFNFRASRSSAEPIPPKHS